MNTMRKPRTFRLQPAAEAQIAEGAEETTPDVPEPTSQGDGASGAPSGRQLRMARRIAQKHGLKFATDEEAVAALRAKGIDPFERSNVLALVPRAESVPAEAPSTERRVAPASAQPPAVTMDAEQRAGEIARIQRDIATRRRRRLATLCLRLAIFVGLPTLVAGYYFYVIATPTYATHSEFVIQQADSAQVDGGGGGLFSPGGLGGQQDSIAVQSYLLSRDALERLDAELDFSGHFAEARIDPLRRLDPDGSREAAYRLYQRMVTIGYDPTEGVLKMEVVAADPETSAAFSEALVGYAEEQVDRLTARLRGDQMEGAKESFAVAEARMLEAQDRVVDLQERLGVVSADAEVANTMGQIGAVETELRLERLRMERLLAVPRPNEARVELAAAAVGRLRNELDGLRAGLTDGVRDEASLARATAELAVAQQDLITRQLLLQQAAQQLESARIEANRQVRYLSTPVPPIAPDEPTYPRAFQNTLLMALIFSGIYLMVSLTVAVLREQVSG